MSSVPRQWGRITTAALAWIALALLADVAMAEPATRLLQIAQASAGDDIWDIIKDTTNIGLLEGFLEGYPNSRHAAAARARLATLKPASTPPVATTPPPATPTPPGTPTPATTPARPPATKAPAPTAVAPKRPAATTTAPAPSAPPQAAAPTSAMFFQPRQGGDGPGNLRVDQCLGLGQRGCGQPAADKFCASRGYARAQAFTAEPASSAIVTWLAGERQICGNETCSALASVTCVERAGSAGPPAEETIAKPRANGVPVAFCFWPSRECGQTTADGICRVIGYGRAARFDAADGVRSIHMGDRTICDGPQCRALTNLVCSR